MWQMIVYTHQSNVTEIILKTEQTFLEAGYQILLQISLIQQLSAWLVMHNAHNSTCDQLAFIQTL